MATLSSIPTSTPLDDACKLLCSAQSTNRTSIACWAFAPTSLIPIFSRTMIQRLALFALSCMPLIGKHKTPLTIASTPSWSSSQTLCERHFLHGPHWWGMNVPFVLIWLLVVPHFSVYNRFVNITALCHSCGKGQHDDPNHKGEVSHFQALTAALSGTVGVGNIVGVAWPSLGGPGDVLDDCCRFVGDEFQICEFWAQNTVASIQMGAFRVG